MTANANTDTTVTVKHGKTEITVPVSEVTDLIVELLAARKAAYELARVARNNDKAARAAERAEAKAARLAAAEEKKAAKIAKLNAQLAELTA